MIAARRLLVALCAACAVAAAAPAARVDWRADALASFDAVWQTIHDTFPDPDFGGVDWPGARDELRPRVEHAATADAARDVIRDLLARLHRSHYVLLSHSSVQDTLPGSATVSIEVRVAPDGVVVTRVASGSSAASADIHPGDLVLAIDGESTDAWVRSAEGADDRARQFDVWRRAYRALHGLPGSVATLRLQATSGPPREVRATRADEPGEIVTFGNLPPLHVTFDAHEVRTPKAHRAGLIAFNYWMTAINAPLDAAVDRFRRDAGLVFDLRGNPGGIALMVTGVAGYVCAKPVVLGTMRTRQTFDPPLSFTANPRTVTADGRRVAPFAGPVAILVDELTASTSECFAGGLQSVGRARVFGRTSAGQALPASTRQLPNGDVLMYAIGDFATASGRQIEGHGVVPDEPQPLDRAALARGHDTTLDAALNWIDRGDR